MPTDSIFNINNPVFSSADFNDSETSSFKATVTYDGNVTWVVPILTMSSCKINVLNFPLDEQVGDGWHLSFIPFSSTIINYHDGITYFKLILDLAELFRPFLITQ